MNQDEEGTPLNSMGLSQTNFGPSKLSKHNKVTNPASRALRKTFQSSSPPRYPPDSGYGSPYKSTRIALKAEELQQYEDRQVTELRQAEEDLASKVYEQASAFKRSMRDKIDASEMAALEWME